MKHILHHVYGGELLNPGDGGLLQERTIAGSDSTASGTNERGP
jgi:hypothetical protein